MLCCYVMLQFALSLIGHVRATAMGKMRNCGMRNAESKMWNQKCGMTLIGRGDKPRDCWLSADYHTVSQPAVR